MNKMPHRFKEVNRMFEKIRAILVKHLRVSPESITEQTNIQEDLSADSLDIVEIIMELEETFDISISDEDAVSLKTVKDLMDYIEKKQK